MLERKTSPVISNGAAANSAITKAQSVLRNSSDANVRSFASAQSTTNLMDKYGNITNSERKEGTVSTSNVAEGTCVKMAKKAVNNVVTRKIDFKVNCGTDESVI